ncbi:MAG: caspase family protein, partial [Gammaproteobacteria bacterium]|nr:caspase family protein [Gammaproteobacteria bacterium]
YPLFAALALAAATLVAPAAAQDRVAVVVGAEGYPQVIGGAPGARTDARHVADALEAEGFAVQLVEDPDETTLKRSLYDLADRLEAAGEGAVGVFYFAGQGAQINGDTFLLPIDARTADDLTLSASALSGELVSARLAAVADAAALIVIDAASPNGLTARFDLEPGLAAFDPPPGGLVIFSHYPDQVALPRQQGVSVFARAFAELVRDGRPDFEGALQALRRSVSDQSGGT